MELPELVCVMLWTSTYGMLVFTVSHAGMAGQSSSEPLGVAQSGSAVARPHNPWS
jgi:hypothetical protein